MAVKQAIVTAEEVKAALGKDGDFLRPIVQSVLQEVLEIEMTETLGAERYERTDDRVSYRSGYYRRQLVTRVGRIELRVPQDRRGHFSTDLFDRYQRSEKALVMALVESYVQGVSTRKVKAITEQLCGQEFSASSVSRLVRKLDRDLRAFASRPLAEEFPYLILDARYEKVREGGVVRNRAVQLEQPERQQQGQEHRQLAELPVRTQEARPARRRVRRQRQPRGTEACRGSTASGRLVAALLRALPAQRAGPSPAEGRFGLPHGAALAV